MRLAFLLFSAFLSVSTVGGGFYKVEASSWQKNPAKGYYGHYNQLPRPTAYYGKKTSLTVEENGEIIKEKMSLTRKKKGAILRVDVPAHGQFQPLTVIVAANTKGDWHTKDNMAFLMGERLMVTDAPIDFDPLDVFKVTQDYKAKRKTLQRKDEEITYTILIEKGNITDTDIDNLHPDILEIIQSSPSARQKRQSPPEILARVTRVQPVKINVQQYETLQKGGRIVVRSTTDENTCASHTSVIFDAPVSHCWRWINPVTSTTIGVHSIVMTAPDGSPTPASISCCHDPNPTANPGVGSLPPEVADCCDRYHPDLCTCTNAFLDASITVSHEEFVTECWGCANVKVRKNVASLTPAEITAVGAALTHAKNSVTSSRFVSIANYHGMPWMCNAAQDGPYTALSCPGDWCPCCRPHGFGTGGDVHFLTWHRLYSHQMEWALQEHDSSFTLPYWDWVASNTLPSLATSGPWLNGPLHPSLSSACGGSVTGRSLGVISSTSLGNQVQNALANTDLLTFSSQIDSPHGSIHVAINCDMVTVQTAAYDPIFHLHHAYIDYLFAYWQELQIIRGIAPHPLIDPANPNDPSHPMNLNLEPFNRDPVLATPNSPNPSPRSRKNCQGKNTFDYRNNFCYEYDELLFRGLTPAQFTTAAPGRRKRRAEQKEKEYMALQFEDVGLTPLEFILYQMEKNKEDRVFIGVTMRKIGVSSEQTVTLCKKWKCFEVTKLHTFESGTQRPSFNRSHGSPYLVEYEVTDLVKRRGWKPFDRDLRAKITSYKGADRRPLPLTETYTPVLIWRPADKEVTAGLEILQVHGESGSNLADTIFADPPFLVDIYQQNQGKRLKIHYQHESHYGTTFGHNEYYLCKRTRAYPKLPGQVTIIQPSAYGWSMDGQVLDTTKPIDHIQGKLLLVVWCSGWSNMNELKDKGSFDQCSTKNVDKRPRGGPISYAVNTARPGPVYLASGVGGQCMQGWKIAVNVQEFKPVQPSRQQQATTPLPPPGALPARPPLPLLP